jgi:hypothetical protein
VVPLPPLPSKKITRRRNRSESAAGASEFAVRGIGLLP